jgi:hypothetical protein
VAEKADVAEKVAADEAAKADVVAKVVDQHDQKASNSMRLLFRFPGLS